MKESGGNNIDTEAPRTHTQAAHNDFTNYLIHKFTVFVDNCRVHHSIKAQAFIRENNIDVIFNVPYGPEFNPIERVWAQIKLQFKKRRLEAVLSGESPDFEKLLGLC